MKTNHVSILFILIAICIIVPGNLALHDYQAVAQKKSEYNRITDDAVEDAIDNMVESAQGDKIILNKDRAVDNFFQSMYSGFGIIDDINKQEYLKLFIPVILVTDEDGYYIYQESLITEADGTTTIAGNWTEKRRYSYYDENSNLTISFTLDDYVSIYDPSQNDVLEGDYHDLAKYYTTISFFQDADSYDTIRRICIIDHLTEDMKDAINNHNRIASQEGILYEFELPTISNEDWYRTIDDISFLALFQGYSFGESLGTYNRYAIGGARIRKADMYYITIEENGIQYYHRANCESLKDTDKKNVYYSKKECAAMGAYPGDCNP